jgi:large subunit ribosomal protein L20
MSRVKNTPVTLRRRKKIIKQAKGYFGAKSVLFKKAKEQVMKSLSYAYRDRKNVKREYHKL